MGCPAFGIPHIRKLPVDGPDPADGFRVRIRPFGSLARLRHASAAKGVDAGVIITAGLVSSGADLGCAPGSSPGQAQPPTNLTQNVFYDEFGSRPYAGF